MDLILIADHVGIQELLEDFQVPDVGHGWVLASVTNLCLAVGNPRTENL